MKKNILLFSLFSFFLSSAAFAQDVPQEQRSLITKVTATWCPHCGSWGWTFMENLMADNADKALIVGAHYSGTLRTDEASAWGDNYNVSGQPVFILNNSNLGINSGNLSSKRTELSNQINTNFEQSPIVNTGLEAFLDGNNVTINTNTRFFQDTSGDYYLGVYVLEDNVFANQSGSVTDNIHPRVLRRSLNGDFGESLTSGAVSAGMEIAKAFDLELNNGWDTDNLRFMAIIWEKEGNTYNFVNGYDINSFSMPSNTENIVLNQLTLAPTVVKNSAILSFEMEAEATTQISLLNVNGQLVNRLYEGQLVRGQHQFDIQNNNYNGVYFVHVQIGNTSFTEKLIFQ